MKPVRQKLYRFFTFGFIFILPVFYSVYNWNYLRNKIDRLYIDQSRAFHLIRVVSKVQMKTPVSVLALLTKLFPNANLEHSISCRFLFYLPMSLVIGHFWLFISYDALNMKDSLPRFVKNTPKLLKRGVF